VGAVTMGVTDIDVGWTTPNSLFWLAFRPVWVVLGTVALVHVAGFSAPLSVRYGTLLLTVVVLGLPHGAVDHLCVPRARNESVSIRALATVGVVYLLFGGAYAVVWFLSPAAGFVSFILLTWFHWGQGDLYPLRTRCQEYPRDLIGSSLILLLRGALPMLVPFVFFPGRYQDVAGLVVGLFGNGNGALASVFGPTVRLGVAGGLGLLTVLALAWGYWTSGGSRGWRIDLSETLLLWLFFASVPPVLAIGLYFSLWHSLRHVFRVIDLNPQVDSSPSPREQVRRFCLDALPTSVGALVFFGLLFVFVPASPSNVEQLTGVYLVLLAVLTLPHVVIVTWLDRKQAVWVGESNSTSDGLNN
jgi:Brp/Blh family beta-carotene 15,15'-monooxygenase